MHRFLNRSGFAGLLPSGCKSAEAQGWRLRDGNLYIEKALLDALCLTTRNLAVPKLSVNNQSNNDVHGYVISDKWFADSHHWLRCSHSRLYTYRRGLRRCSFRQIGRCQSLETWDEQQVDSHASFMCSLTFI